MPKEWNTTMIALFGGLFGLLIGLFFEWSTLAEGGEFPLTLLKLFILSGIGALTSGGVAVIRNLFVV